MKIIQYRNLFLVVLLLVVMDVKTQNKSEYLVNNDPFSKSYKKSRKYFYGKLSLEQYAAFRLNLEKELDTKLPIDKAIIINYHQAARNCYFYGRSKSENENNYQRIIEITKSIADAEHGIAFFLYNKNYYDTSILKEMIDYREDSGFISENVFTLHENCEANFVLKPNRKFMINYGTDSLTEVEKYLKKSNKK